MTKKDRKETGLEDLRAIWLGKVLAVELIMADYG